MMTDMAKSALHRPRVKEARCWVEGEYLTTTEIAERIGTSYSSATRRLYTARHTPGPVTWEKLLPKKEPV